MKRLMLLAVCLVPSLGLAKMRVVATVGDLGAIAREVGGEQTTVEVLAKASQDPHFVDAKPSLVLSLSRADLLLYMGIDLEIGWLPTLVTGSRNPEVQSGQPGNLDCSTLINPLEVPQQKLDRSMGDIHPGGNPHYTLDPRAALRVAKGIAARLGQLDPEHAGDYAKNLARFEKELSGQIAAWQAALAPFKGTEAVAYHKSWIYFAEFAGLHEVAFVEPKPGLPPSSGHVAKVLQIIRARKVKLILQEDWYQHTTSELLANKGGAKLVRVKGMTPDGQRYAEHIDEVVRAMVAALEG
ncbi:MAG: metal ABC transporter substrate-binding protein [Myxococcaceae bacterium]